MKGVESKCTVCGATGYVYGCPSWSDECVDKQACRDRAIATRDREIWRLKLIASKEAQVRLTEYNTGHAVYVQPGAIKSMRRISASVSECGGDVARERGERTRVDTASDCFLVTETPEEIVNAANVITAVSSTMEETEDG